MRIAVTYENGQIFQHFGHTGQFKLYDVEDGQINASEVADADGQGHGALSGFLSGRDVDVLICGGIGEGAQSALKGCGIQLLCGVSGEADQAVEAYLNGNLEYSLDGKCSHHDHSHGHGHECGGHGGHSCGSGEKE